MRVKHLKREWCVPKPPKDENEETWEIGLASVEEMHGEEEAEDSV